MVDLDDIANKFMSDDTLCVEVSVYKSHNGKNLIRETFTIDYFDDDYQWSKTAKHIHAENIAKK